MTSTVTTLDLKAIDGTNWEGLRPLFDALAAEELMPGGVGNWLLRWSDLLKVIYEAGARAERAKSEDTTDTEAEAAFLHHIETVVPQTEVASQALKTKLLAVPGYVPAPNHVQMVKRLRSDADLFRAENVPIQSHLDVLANEYDKIAGSLAVTIGGEEMTLPQAGLRLLQTDRAAREQAWQALSDKWLSVRPQLDALYLQMLPLRRALARNAGKSDFRAYMWQEKHRDYTPQDALSFHDAIAQEIVPLVSQLLERRREALGLSALRPWDLQVDPHGRAPLHPFDTAAELEEGTARIFAQVAPALGEQFGRLRARMLDLPSRAGKAPGGYCSSFPVTGLPYIFMNAVGTQDDVQTLLHEGGHAFHDIASAASQPLVWNQGAPMEFCEVASMAMELLGAPYLARDKGGFYTPEDAARAHQEHLARTIEFLPYMAVVDGFQHWVYVQAPDDVTASDMDAHWDKLWARFMPGVDWSGLEAMRMTGWHRKLHIFQNPFYYVEYGLAQLGALQVWRNALADQAQAVQKYRDALALGDTRPLPDLYDAAGARLAFDAPTISELASLAASHLDITA